MTEPRVVTEPLGGAPLVVAAMAGALPAEWYPSRPSDPAAWRQRAGSVAAGNPGWLHRLRPAFGSTGAGVGRLERTAAAGGVVVTTGQQPGLFGGPIYTLSKALSALALADTLEQATGVAAAPVFWAATDDADFAEASVTHVAVRGGVDTLRMDAPAAEGAPMARVPLGDVRPLLTRLLAGAGSAADGRVLDAVRRAYAPDAAATVGSAYVALLRTLLEPLGIAVLDASHPAVRAAGGAVVRRALDEGAAVADALASRDQALAAAGFSPQVPTVRGLTLVFRSGADGTKQRVAIDGAARAAVAGDDELGPNVLLRPVVERAILPTVAYVAGPGELAYFAQVSAVAAALDADAPLAVPRWSGTIVEPHVERLVARLGLTIGELRDPHAAETRLARAAMPDELRAALAGAGRAADGAVAAVRTAPGGDAVPEAVLTGTAAALASRLGRLERRYVAAFKQRETALMHDVATARGALWPLGKRQERVLNAVPVLARQGDPLVRQMRSHASEAMTALVGVGSSRAAGGRG